MRTIQETYTKEAVPQLMKKFGHKTPMAVPRIRKVVLNVGIGKLREKKDAVETVVAHLTMLAGQKPAPRPARIAVSSFKTREGMIVGYKVTLQGKMMFDFLNRLVNLAIPRTRDFRGLNPHAIDEGGNLTLGIKEHIVFPEMIGEDVRTIFGLEVTVVTNAKSKDEARELFTLLGFPFKR